MIRDITIGQYYPAKSVLHRLDPRTKFLGTLGFLISVFLFHTFLGYAVATVFLVAMIAISKVPVKFMFKGLKAIVMILLITVVFNIILTPGEVLWRFGIIKVTKEGLVLAGRMAIRLVYLVIGSSIMTLTTTPNHLTDGLERLLRPLNKIRVPVHVAEAMKKVQRISKELQQSLGREATPEEIAEKLGDKSTEDVKNILSYLQNPVSLETPVGEDGENNLGDMVEDKASPTPEEAMNLLVQKEEVSELLNALNDREKQVIRLRYGLEDGKTHTLEEIGEELKVTRERVRQIESRAMEKLRNKAER